MLCTSTALTQGGGGGRAAGGKEGEREGKREREAARLRMKENKKTLSITEHRDFFFLLLNETRLRMQFIIFYLEDVRRPVKPRKMKYVSWINCEYSVFSLCDGTVFQSLSLRCCQNPLAGTRRFGTFKPFVSSQVLTPILYLRSEIIMVSSC